MVVHAGAEIGLVVAECARDQHGVAAIIIEHAAAGHRRVAAEGAVVKPWAGALVVDAGAAGPGLIVRERAVADRGAAGVVVHAGAATVRGDTVVRVAGGDGEAVEEGGVGGAAAGDDVIGVLAVVATRVVVAVEVAIEDGNIHGGIAVAERATSTAGRESAVERHVVDELERGAAGL